MGTIKLTGLIVLSAVRRRRFGFPFNVLNQVSVLRLPQDRTPRSPEMDDPRGIMKPQSIQYPPGMEPKNPCSWTWEDEPTTLICGDIHRYGR